MLFVKRRLADTCSQAVFGNQEASAARLRLAFAQRVCDIGYCKLAPERAMPTPNTAVLRFSCPTCNFALSAPAEKAGAKSHCPNCKQPVQVPELVTALPGDASPSS